MPDPVDASISPPGAASEPAPAGLRTPGKGRRALRLAAALAAGLVLLELAVRFLLFSDAVSGTHLARRVRNAGLFAPVGGREFWKLEAAFAPRSALRPHASFDARVGWLKAEIEPGTYRHADEDDLAGRTPVLLFGDSFAQCVERAELCWEELLERSELAPRYRLLNYGVGGYGLDQVYLLLRQVLERHRARRPVVVLAVLVDDDLDRSYLGLRNHVKPYFSLRGEELLLHELESRDAASFLRANPIGIPSYVGRWILFGSGLVAPARALAWTAEADHVAVKQALNGRILAEIRRELEGSDVPWFFLLFHGRSALAGEAPYGWQEPFLYGAFERLGLSFVSSRRYLREHMRRTGAVPGSYYFDERPARNHYTDEANSIVFQALRDGLLGRFEPYEYLPER